MKVTATQQIEVELSDRELSYALMRWALEQYGLSGTDDAGCDWMTDDAGNTYISGADWRVSTVPAFAALVDAANQMRYGERLIVQPLVQPTMFPDGEDTPLFTLPNDTQTCIRCGRYPDESGIVTWATCDICGEPVCDTCAYHENEGYFCGQKCLNEAIGVEEIEQR